jgi:hypothetical protein
MYTPPPPTLLKKPQDQSGILWGFYSPIFVVGGRGWIPHPKFDPMAMYAHCHQRLELGTPTLKLGFCWLVLKRDQNVCFCLAAETKLLFVSEEGPGKKSFFRPHQLPNLLGYWDFIK